MSKENVHKHRYLLRVWSGAPKIQNSSAVANCNKVPNVTKRKRELDPPRTKHSNKLCRICLQIGFKPIYRENSNSDLADAIITIGGIELSAIDCYPKYLCEPCFMLLKSAILFRNTAQLSDKLLRKTQRTQQQSVKLKTKTNDAVFSDNELSNNDQELCSCGKQLIGPTKVIDHNMNNQIKTPEEPKPKQNSKQEPEEPNQDLAKSNDLNSRDDNSCNDDSGSNLEEDLNDNTSSILKETSETKTKTTKLINIVMPKGKGNTNIANQLQEYLNQNIKKTLRNSSETNMKSSKILNEGDHYNCSGIRNELQESLNQNLIKILQNLPNTKLKQAQVINIVLPGDGDNNYNNKSNTPQGNNEQNKSEIQKKIPDTKLDHPKTLYIVKPKHITGDERVNITGILKITSDTKYEQAKIDQFTSTDGQSNTNNMKNTLLGNVQHNLADTPKNCTETVSEAEKLNINEIATDDYFGVDAIGSGERIPTILERRNKILETTKLICEVCGLLYNSVRNYITHNKEKHTEKKKLQCTICQKSYSLKYFERHMFGHRVGPFICEICGKSFNDKANFKSHSLSHSIDFPFKCNLCEYRGPSKRYVKLHMLSHTIEKPYKCPQCPQQFINTGNLQRHIFKHRGEKPFKCDTCKTGFYTKSELKMHIKGVHLGIRRNSSCGLCGLLFTTRRKLSIHERNVHKMPELPPHGVPLYVKYDMKQQQQNILLKK